MLSIVLVLAISSPAMAFPDNCPNVTVIHSVEKDGWYGACLGLQKQEEVTDSAGCKQQCYTNMNCSVWQYVKQSATENACWSGNVVHGCLSRAGDAAKFEKDLIAGERIQHGFVRVVSKNDFETMGLKNYPEAAGTQEERVARCKLACETDVTCSVWEFGKDSGCWLEHNPGAVAGARKEHTDFDHNMVAGETLEHTCPPYVAPEGGLPWPWIISGIVLGLLALGAIIYALQKKPKVKKTRAVKIEPKPEPTPVYWVPQPTVLVPQTSVVVMPQYQPVQTYAAPIQTYAAPQYAAQGPVVYR